MEKNQPSTGEVQNPKSVSLDGEDKRKQEFCFFLIFFVKLMIYFALHYIYEIFFFDVRILLVFLMY